MKDYLSLVSEYAKVHKKKNRLTVICISISVMLVTAIFGMADMSIKAQKADAIRKYGNWHISISNISQQTSASIASRDDIALSGLIEIARGAAYQGKELLVQSSGKELAEGMNLTVTEGHYPLTEGEALTDRQALEEFGLAIGDSVEVDFSNGETKIYQISGVYSDFSSLKSTDAHGLQLAENGLRFLPEGEYREYYYIRFKSGTAIQEATEEIKSEYGLTDEQVSANNILLGLMGQSRDLSMLGVYLTAAVLFILVTMAGTFMIAGSFNMSVLDRTQFFGLLRCLGATKRQIKKYIRREGLLYCLKGIPIGLFGGTAILWASVFILNMLNSQYIPEMPRFQISIPGVLAGMIIGILVVMIASGSPAKKAARVSPQSAVTGNIDRTDGQGFKKASDTRLFHVDTAMGLYHAFSNKKSMVLIAGSFSISIVLFLCFTILVTFMNHALRPLAPYAPDLTIEETSDAKLLPLSLKDELTDISGVEKVYGVMFYDDIPAVYQGAANTAALVSYDEPQFEWAEDYLISGNIDEVKKGDGVLVEHGYSQEFDWSVGDTITPDINGTTHNVKIAGVVSDVPFKPSEDSWSIICSENTFTSLTGISSYQVINLQVSEDISGEVRNRLASGMKLMDMQQHNQEVRTAYYAVAVFVYGFLVVIALVALINIINTVNASVSGRIKNYGVMRAVGMSSRQLKRVVQAEAAAYAVVGSITGGIWGLILHRIFFDVLITSNWGQKWKPPVSVLAAVIGAALLTAFLAVMVSAAKIKRISIVNVVNSD